MTAVFDADVDPDSTLLRVAEEYFLELQRFGRMATSLYQLPENVKVYIALRAIPMNQVFGELERAIGLRFASSIPHSYALGRWPPHVQFAGRTGRSDTPSPSLVVAAMLDNWEAGTWATTYLRLLRSALFVVNREGLLSGIHYLLDLHAAGGAPQEESVARVIVELIQARASVDSDNAIAPLLLGTEIPKDSVEWSQTLTSLPELKVPFVIDALPPPAKIVLKALLERAVTDVAAVRKSRDYDSWFSDRLRIGGLLRIVAQIFGHGLYEGNHRPLAVEAILSELEEIESDAPAISQSLFMNLPPSSREDLGKVRDQAIQILGVKPENASSLEPRSAERLCAPRLKDELAWVRNHIAVTYAATYGERSAEELIKRRLLVPETLGTEAVSEADFPISDDWKGLSWRLAHAYTLLFEVEHDPDRICSSPFSARELLTADPDLIGLLTREGVPTGDQEAFVARLMEQLKHGWDPKARFGLHHPDIDAKYSDWMRELDDYSGQLTDIVDAIKVAYQSAATLELNDLLLQLASVASHPQVFLDTSERVLQRYPWNRSIRFGRSKAYASLGLWGQSIDEAIIAVILTPTDPSGWAHLQFLSKAKHQRLEATAAGALAKFFDRDASSS